MKTNRKSEKLCDSSFFLFKGSAQRAGGCSHILWIFVHYSYDYGKHFGGKCSKNVYAKSCGEKVDGSGGEKVCCLDKNLQVSNVNLPFQWVDCYSGPEFIREENFITCLSNKLSK